MGSMHLVAFLLGALALYLLQRFTGILAPAGS